MIEVTPTANVRLPFRAGDFATLAEGLDYAARGETGVNFFSSRGSLEQALPYRELRRQALAIARRLAGSGLERGDRIGIIAETSPAFLTVFFACQYAGFVPVPLPLSINFGGKHAYVERLRGMLAAAGARAAVAGPELIGILREAVAATTVEFAATADELMAWPEADGVLEPLGADDVCYIQYSSGSTSFPRGVLVTQAALAANARSIAVDGLALRPGDRCTSWLPLYHDMGTGRLLPDAGDDADLGRLSQHHGVRAAAARLARADLALRRHDLVRPDLRLRALRAQGGQWRLARSRPQPVAGRRDRRRDDPPAGARRLRRHLRGDGLRCPSRSCRARHGRGDAGRHLQPARRGVRVDRVPGATPSSASIWPCRPARRCRLRAAAASSSVVRRCRAMPSRSATRRAGCCPSGMSGASASRGRA
jgi:hypothetical protein